MVALWRPPWRRASGATTLERLGLAQMARAADLVVRARCTATASGWEGAAIWTVNHFEVLEHFKGAPPAQLAVRVPGGRVGHLVMTVEAAPKFRPGEEGVLFLEKTALGDYAVTGWAEGTFRIRHGNSASQPAVTQDSASLPLFNATTRTFVSDGIRNLPLDQFRQRLAAALAESTPGAKPQGAKQ